MGLTSNLGKLSNMITSTGSAVGIGTSSPQSGYILDVKGFSQFGNSIYPNVIRLGDQDTNSTIIQSVSTAGVAKDLTFWNTSERMRITSTGNVSIGNTNDTYKLDVSGTGTFRAANGVNIIGPTGNPAYLTTDQSVNNGGKRWRIGHTGAASGWSSFDIYNQTDNILGMTITSTGVVGIGTSSPTVLGTGYATLDVRGSSGGGINMGNGTYSGYIYCDTEFRLQSSNSAITFLPSGSEKMRITSAGNLGIGTSSPNYSLVVNGSIQTGYILLGDVVNNNNSTIEFTNGPNSTSYGGGGHINYYGSGLLSLCYGGGKVGIGVNNPAYTLDLRRNVYQDWLVNFQNSNTDATEYGLLIQFVGGTASNNSGSYFFYAGDSGAQRFSVRGNGGIYNFQANDSNLSDIRTKKDIIPLESYWDKFKAIEIVKFKYKDQDHDDFNIGVIAQQVEGVAPEFIDTDYWENPSNENKTEMKSVYTTDLYHATIKVLQEAMTKIEELEARIKTLENK